MCARKLLCVLFICLFLKFNFLNILIAVDFLVVFYPSFSIWSWRIMRAESPPPLCFSILDPVFTVQFSKIFFFECAINWLEKLGLFCHIISWKMFTTFNYCFVLAFYSLNSINLFLGLDMEKISFKKMRPEQSSITQASSPKCKYA